MSHENTMHHAPAVASVAADELLPGGRGAAAGTRNPLPFSKRFQQTIITIHRWIGIILCVMMLIWFISGLVLAYVRFPAMDSIEKLSVLKPVDWTQIQVTPAAALAAARLPEFPQEMRLEMSGGKPVYRIVDWKKRHIAVSAVTGERLSGVSAEQAVDIVREQLSAPGATLKAADVDSDQWTITGYWNKERPFHVVALNDALGTEYYVSIATGEIVLDTRRAERALNWVGAIPHWIYFEFVRHYSREGVWTWTIYVIASAGIFVALSGLWIGFSRLRLRIRYANGSWTPFKGWMKWHHATGIVGGVLLALWVISGLFTMYPGGFLEQRKVSGSEYKRYAGNQRAEFPFDAIASLGAQGRHARRAILEYIDGRPLLALEDGESAARTVDAVTGLPAPLSLAQLTAAAKALMPDANVVSTAYLEKGDEYWHSGFHFAKTPIVRVVFDDPAGSWFHIDPESGVVLGILDKIGRMDRWTVVAIHDVDWNWLLTRRPLWDLVLFAVTVPGILIVISTLVISYRRLQRTNLIPAGISLRRSPFTAGAGHGRMAQPREPASDSILVGFASQTGTAELLANKTADSLRRAGLSADVRNLADIGVDDLVDAQRAIFIVSTTGDGDAPDRVLPFQRRIMRTPLTLSGMQYALLALGDQQYRTYCSFGNAVDDWLRKCGARQIFPAVQVNDHSVAALAKWSRELSVVTGRNDDFTLNREPYKPWRLVERRHINPGSAGAEVFHFAFEPVESPVTWEAGDIAQLVAGRSWNDFAANPEGLAEREYSIASTPDLGQLHLLVRLMRGPDGQPGLASGPLTQTFEIGETIPLRVRRNPGFHGPADDRPLILIGSGTGIAGLRAHLLRRAALGHRRNWLIFGERNAVSDSFYADDLSRWAASGELQRLDLVFSRDQPRRRYVQDALYEAADELRAWVDAGAAVYVCGNLHGMAPAVTERLVAVLGEACFEELSRTGRYRRDVY